MKLGYMAFACSLLGMVGSGCRSEPPAFGRMDEADVIRVKTLRPQRVELARTTRQPATVHAYYRAELYAKVAGYLSQLQVDIGTKVKRGDVLAVVDVPEMVKERARLAATVQQLEAEQRRAAAEVEVAQAAADKARANVKRAEAKRTAARLQQQRISGLVQQRAVADRLLDEVRKRYEEAAAETDAAEQDVKLAIANSALSRARAEAARAETEVARQALAELDERLQYAVLKAPFDGVVTERNVDLGDLVRDAQSGGGADRPPLLVICQLDRVRIRVPVPERDAPLVSVGDAAHVMLRALGSQPIEAKVSRIAGGLDPSTRTMQVEIDVPNPEGTLMPGMYGEVTIDLEPKQARLVLPAAALRYDQRGASFVYTVSPSGEIQQRPVQTGLDDGSLIEITEGLTGDERVVAPTQGRLRPGQKVRVAAR